MRVRRNKNLEQIIDQSEYVIRDFPYEAPYNTILELGSGKGDMLNAMALKNPQFNYLGIEKDRTISAKALKLFTKNNLKNIKLIIDDISKLEELVNGYVDEIWLTFSDPWPKKRHELRRLTSPKFLEIYKKILTPSGTLKLKTDNDDLFNYSLETMEKANMKIVFRTNDLQNSIRDVTNVKTSYENKWIAKNKNINYLEAVYNDF